MVDVAFVRSDASMTAPLVGAAAALLVVVLAVRLVQPMPASMASVDHLLAPRRRRQSSLTADHLVHPGAIAGAVVLLPVTAGLSLLVPIVGLGVRALRVRARRRAEAERTSAVINSLPELIDLLLLTVGSGLVLREAIAAVVGIGRQSPVDRALAEALAALDGAGLADEVEQRLGELGEPARPLASVLASGLRYGAPVAGPLERLVHDARLARRRRAETQARRLPVLLLLPLVLCGLPSFILLAVVPVALSAIDQLSL